MMALTVSTRRNIDNTIKVKDHQVKKRISKLERRFKDRLEGIKDVKGNRKFYN